MDSYRQILKNGLWVNNQAFVALLGLCPLLAVSNTLINGLGLGIATTLTLILSNTLISLVRQQVGGEIRLPVFVLIIASIVTIIELIMNAYFYELYLILGIFIPLIVTNCAIIGRAEAYASKNPVGASAMDGLSMGLGFTAALVLLGALREIIGSGTLFANAHLMFGEAASGMTLTLIDDYEGFLLAILPPGAFIGLGLLIALKNVIDKRLAKPSQQTVTVDFATKKA
ncbi:electron transport complex subunit RsxE [Cycloclasticus sp. 46_83_sub15_T18]|nr:electron transport complex subunit RsxE [Cycloclasticus sp. 46_83_sub15_T18]